MGAIFDPEGDHAHGCPSQSEDHKAGDLGNVVASQLGIATMDLKVPSLQLTQLLGRVLVLTTAPDDCKSQPNGAPGSASTSPSRQSYPLASRQCWSDPRAGSADT